MVKYFESHFPSVAPFSDQIYRNRAEWMVDLTTKVCTEALSPSMKASTITKSCAAWTPHMHSIPPLRELLQSFQRTCASVPQDTASTARLSHSILFIVFFTLSPAHVR